MAEKDKTWTTRMIEYSGGEEGRFLIEITPWLESYTTRHEVDKAHMCSMLAGLIGLIAASDGLDLPRTWTEGGMSKIMFHRYESERKMREAMRSLPPEEQKRLADESRAALNLPPIPEEDDDATRH